MAEASPTPSEIAAAEEADKETVEFMLSLLNGVSVLKHGRTGWPHKRLLWLDVSKEELALRWGKPELGIVNAEAEEMPIGVIDEVNTGQVSDVLKRSGSKKNADKYVSFVTDDRTLDIEFETKAECDAFVMNMQFLLENPSVLQDTLLHIVHNGLFKPPAPKAKPKPAVRSSFFGKW